jgi:hypothetical protein
MINNVLEEVKRLRIERFEKANPINLKPKHFNMHERWENIGQKHRCNPILSVKQNQHRLLLLGRQSTGVQVPVRRSERTVH